MAETELTKEIKKALLHYTKADAPGVYGCYEVCLGAGYGDEYYVIWNKISRRMVEMTNHKICVYIQGGMKNV